MGMGQVQIFGQVSSAMVISILVVFFFLELWTLIERRKSITWITLYRYRNLTLIAIFSLTTSALFVAICGGLLWWYDWTNFRVQCVYFSQLGITVSYVFMKQVLYLFLFLKMKLVHDSTHFRNRLVKYTRGLVLFTIVFGIPVIFFPLIVVYFSGYVTQSGVCIQFTLEVAPIIAFAACDLALSVLMLSLFVLPLTSHATIVEAHRGKKNKLRRIAKKNLILSSVALSSTFFMLVFMTVAEVDLRQHREFHFTYVHILHTIFAEIDLLVGAVVVHSLSSAWMPSFLFEYVARTKSKKVAMTNSSNGTKVENNQHIQASTNPLLSTNTEKEPRTSPDL